MSALFGPAGTPDDFSSCGYRSSQELPDYLLQMKLDLVEYQCGQGVRIGEETARSLGAKAREKGILLSLHAPYFISLSSVEEEKRERSLDYILQAARAASWMGAERVVVHSGSCAKISREEALNLARDTLRLARKRMLEEGLEHIRLCPETMGKMNQLGNLEEVLELCGVDESFLPCIDFGHLNARTLGGISGREEEAYGEILSALEQKLGTERASRFHSHFSKIEYTEKGGEKRHLTFESGEQFGPRFEPLMDWVAKKGWSPVFVCESAGTQGKDAFAMKQYYQSLTDFSMDQT